MALLYTGTRAIASLTAERSTVASAEGGFAELDQVRGVWSYALTELDRVGADAAWQDSKGQSLIHCRRTASGPAASFHLTGTCVCR